MPKHVVKVAFKTSAAAGISSPFFISVVLVFLSHWSAGHDFCRFAHVRPRRFGSLSH